MLPWASFWEYNSFWRHRAPDQQLLQHPQHALTITVCMSQSMLTWEHSLWNEASDPRTTSWDIFHIITITAIIVRTAPKEFTMAYYHNNPRGSPSKRALNYHFKNKPNTTLKNGLWSNCLPPLTIGSSYSNCLCRASGRPFTKAARALPVKLFKATKQYFIIEIHNAGEPLDLFHSCK